MCHFRSEFLYSDILSSAFDQQVVKHGTPILRESTFGAHLPPRASECRHIHAHPETPSPGRPASCTSRFVSAKLLDVAFSVPGRHRLL